MTKGVPKGKALWEPTSRLPPSGLAPAYTSGASLSLGLNSGDLAQAQDPAARGRCSDCPFPGSVKMPGKIRPGSGEGCIQAAPVLAVPSPGTQLYPSV